MMEQINSALITGESAQQMQHIPSESVDLIITSPPYDDLRAYNGYVFDFNTFRKVARQCYRVLKPGGTLVWVVADATKDGTETFTSLKQALYFKETVGFLAHDTMIYHRENHPLTRRRYEQHWEYMFVFTKGKPKTFNGIRVPKLYPETRPRKTPKYFGRNKDNSRDFGTLLLTDSTKLAGNVWKIKLGQSTASDPIAHEHPAIFPEELAQRHIESWSNPGDVVLDPMCGSGTVGKMALTLGRKFIGIDVSADYIDIAKRRLRCVRATGTAPTEAVQAQ